jgi:hypothetical protein
MTSKPTPEYMTTAESSENFPNRIKTAAAVPAQNGVRPRRVAAPINIEATATDSSTVVNGNK